jgi:hypothetical protein
MSERKGKTINNGKSEGPTNKKEIKEANYYQRGIAEDD